MRFPRKILDPRASPQRSRPKDQPSFRKIDILEATDSNHVTKGIAELPRPPSGGLNPFSASIHAANTADTPYTLSIAAELHAACFDPQDPKYRRANDAEKSANDAMSSKRRIFIRVRSHSISFALL